MGVARSPIQNYQGNLLRSQIPAVFNQATLRLRQLDQQKSDSLKDIARRITRTGATSRAQFASSGFSVASQSFLQVMAARQSALEYEASRVQKSGEIQRQSIWYNAQVQAVSLENQARMSDLQGSLLRYDQNRKMISNLVSGAGQTIGSLF